MNRTSIKYLIGSTLAFFGSLWVWAAFIHFVPETAWYHLVLAVTILSGVAAAAGNMLYSLMTVEI